MPVRQLTSSVLKWPDAEMVSRELRRWTKDIVCERKDVLRIGYFGSYARGDWGVGSDLDLVIVVKSSSKPFERRAIEWDATSLPVPADVLVYTEEEWGSLTTQIGFFQTLIREMVWIYVSEDSRQTFEGGIEGRRI